MNKLIILSMLVLLTGIWTAGQATTTKAAEKAPGITKTESEKTKAVLEVKVEKKEVKSEKISTMEVVEIGIATSIENREPVNVAKKFEANVSKLYCYVKIKGGSKGSKVIHRWKKGDEIMAIVSLRVDGSPWRTFSSKNISVDWAGTWTVDILDGEEVIKSINFIVE